MLAGKRIGIGMSGSFCSLEASLKAIRELKNTGADLYCVMSDLVFKEDSRFMKASDVRKEIEDITGHHIIRTIHEAETLGPKSPLDLMVILPCSANTMAKLATGLCDNALLMATKATLRNLNPVVLGVFTNDALGNSGTNIMKLINTKHIFFIPFGQDDPINKPNSMVCDPKKLIPTCVSALKNEQYQPVIIAY